MRIGSTGVSVAISDGVTTTVAIRTSRITRIRVTFNGRHISRRSVSGYVAERFIEIDGRNRDLEVSHESRVPMGCGYGTSGAGALGVALVLNEGLGLSLTTTEAAQIAHVAEIRCRTGLGTVASASVGGFTLRLKPGAPRIGVVRRIPFSPSVRLISATFGPLSTPTILGAHNVKKRINLCARGLSRKFERHATEANFMTLSRRFAYCIGLMSRRLSSLIRALDSAGFESSMMMLGESVFCVLPIESTRPLVETMRGWGLTPMVSRIARIGAHLL